MCTHMAETRFFLQRTLNSDIISMLRKFDFLDINLTSIASLCHSKNMKDFLLDIRDIILYDLLKKTPPKPKKLELELDFIAHKEKGGGVWLEAKNYPGLIASGDTPEELRKALWDSILTYFDVPRPYAKRLLVSP